MTKLFIFCPRLLFHGRGILCGLVRLLQHGGFEFRTSRVRDIVVARKNWMQSLSGCEASLPGAGVALSLSTPAASGPRRLRHCCLPPLRPSQDAERRHSSKPSTRRPAFNAATSFVLENANPTTEMLAFAESAADAVLFASSSGAGAFRKMPCLQSFGKSCQINIDII